MYLIYLQQFFLFVVFGQLFPSLSYGWGKSQMVFYEWLLIELEDRDQLLGLGFSVLDEAGAISDFLR